MNRTLRLGIWASTIGSQVASVIHGEDALSVPLQNWRRQLQAATNESNTSTSTSNPSNSTSNTSSGPCETHCCYNEIREEALLACSEYFGWGMTPQRCAFWQQSAQQVCVQTCGNCTLTANAIYTECLYFTQDQRMTVGMQRRYCRATRDTFREGRCPSACLKKVPNCYTNTSAYCNEKCGNFEKCGCYPMRDAYGAPDACDGATHKTGLVPGRIGLSWNCLLMDMDCKNHLLPQGTCGLYRHCPVNLCIVLNITCPRISTCKSNGTCVPQSGQCIYSSLPDGQACDDGLHYTHSDSCYDGVCVGIENKCLRLQVNCTTPNPCLQSPGSCHPPTGHCVFSHQPDGLPCHSSTATRQRGICQGGMCRRNITDLCKGKNCRPHFQHHACISMGRCDYKTGACIPIPVPEGFPCNDNRSNTLGDRCIEGQCVGDAIGRSEMAATTQAGVCTVHGSLAMPSPRYYGDAFDAQACNQQCVRDPACTAASYGYHTCFIFGGNRSEHPAEAYWGRAWVLDAAPLVVEMSLECFKKVAHGSIKKVDRVRVVDVIFTACVWIIGTLPVLVFFSLYLTHIPAWFRPAQEPDTVQELPKPSSPKINTVVSPSPEPPMFSLQDNASGAPFDGGSTSDIVVGYPATQDPRGAIHDQLGHQGTADT